jgi:asparaginyl-tRNA synthetase
LTKRIQKNVTFINLNDGTTPKGIQLIIENNNDTKDISIGTSLKSFGILVKSPSEKQQYELNVKLLNIIGKSDTDGDYPDYPLAKSRMPLDYLRKIPHLRTRTSSFGSIFRIKSAISNATNIFFMEKGFLHINPNIITTNECEGGAGVFQLTEHDISDYSKLPNINKTLKHDWSKDFFDQKAFLTVSSQLELEALACSLGPVYTTNKSFRSEHSVTNKHLAEFEHLEVEDVFITLEDLMQLGEDYIKYVGNYILINCMDDIINLDKFVSKGLLERIKTIINYKFVRITYKEAIKILMNAENLTQKVIQGEDLCSEFENYLTEHYKGPVFVTHWTSKLKSFYMKQNEDSQCDEESGVCYMYPQLCDNFDLLMPYKVGELIGGSMREDNIETLERMMKEKNINPEPLQFYLDLRKYGTVPHGGFGLGLDRMCMLFTGMENIKDVVAFPVFYKNSAI